MSKKIIEISNLTKKYFKGTYDFNFLKDYIKYAFNKNEKNFHNNYFNVLDDINLSIDEAEKVAFLGRNGAGKSTLCKIISKITEPDVGQIKIRGNTVPMLNLFYGLELECTCLENIHFLCSVYGLKHNEIKEKLDDIVEFSELKNYLNMPLKKFSSGMLTRLVFACLVHTKGDIYIADEILAISDNLFKEKCINKLISLNKKGKTLICISHEKEIITSLCDSAFVFGENGKITKKLPINEAYNIYDNIKNDN